MIPEMRLLLKRLKSENQGAAPQSPVMQVRECQKAMNRAAKQIGMERITHHDLRHLFATRSIESGVDIPTVSRWLGHKGWGCACNESLWPFARTTFRSNGSTCYLFRKET